MEREGKLEFIVPKYEITILIKQNNLFHIQDVNLIYVLFFTYSFILFFPHSLLCSSLLRRDAKNNHIIEFIFCFKICTF